jgi:hypothetical protein
MKKSITLTALLLIIGIGVCTTVSANDKGHKMSKTREQVSLIPLRTNKGFAVRVDKQEPGKSMVIVSNSDGDVVYKDLLTTGTNAEKKYIFTQLDNGNYTVEVFSKTHDVKTSFNVYNKGQRKIVHLL